MSQQFDVRLISNNGRPLELNGGQVSLSTPIKLKVFCDPALPELKDGKQVRLNDGRIVGFHYIELKILDHLLKGLSRHAIADKISHSSQKIISEQTVKKYCENIYSLLSVNSAIDTLNLLPGLTIEAVNPPLHGALTPRQVTILNLRAQGLTNQQVANEIGIQPQVVKNVTRDAYDRLGVGYLIPALKRATRIGLMEEGPFVAWHLRKSTNEMAIGG